MTNKLLSYGTPQTVQIDYATGVTDLTCARPVNQNIHDHWKDQFVQYPEVIIALSGGLDSQFSALVAKQSGALVTAVTFEFIWQDNVVNSYDVLTARDFCNKNDIPFSTMRIDIDYFLDKLLIDYCKQYRFNSPQVGVQVYAMQQLMGDNPGVPIVMGGDWPLIQVSKGIVYNPVAKQHTDLILSNQHAYMPNKYKHTLGPFLFLAEEQRTAIIRDPFLMSPEILYLSLQQHASVIQEHQIAAFNEPESIKSSCWLYKQAYYQSYGFDFLLPLAKRTGFELIKGHLASLSGVYDDFDIRYRYPLEKVIETFDLFGYKGVEAITRYNGEDYTDLLDHIQNVYDDVQPSNVNTYSFDW